MTLVRWTRLTAVAVAAGALLTACDPAGTPGAGPSGSTSATRTSTTTPTPSPTATSDDAAPGPSALACDTIVPAAVYEGYLASGLQLTPPAEFFAKIRSEIPSGFVSPWLFFEDNGGIVCTWHDGSEVIWVYGYVSLPADQFPAFDAAMLGGDPYLREESDAVLYTSQMDANPFTYVLAANGPTYVASTIEDLNALRATVP